MSVPALRRRGSFARWAMAFAAAGFFALASAQVEVAGVAELGEVRGADLSFLKQQEDAGRRFSDSGLVKPGLRIFRDHGYNWVRLRLFHTVANSPVPLPNDLAYTLAMAQQAKTLGFKFLLDLHYSDTWADPGAQSPPKAWQGLAGAVLADSIQAYTRAVLRRFLEEGCAPDMVQLGNEINNGFLWPAGAVAHFSGFAALLKAARLGVDSAFAPLAAPWVMVHVACGGDTAATRWFFDAVDAEGLRYDVIGQSYYPMWHGTLDDLGRNLAMTARRYAKPMVVVETAFSAYPDGAGGPFPLTDEGQAAYLRAIDSLVRAAPLGLGKGLLWWEPTGEAYLGGPRGLFDRQLRARPALYVFDGRPVTAKTPRERARGRFIGDGLSPMTGFSGPKVLLLQTGGRFQADGRRIKSEIPDRDKRFAPASRD